MSSECCDHVKAYIENNETNTFRFLHAMFVSCVAEGSRKRKALDCKCSICSTRCPRIFACISCAFFGCFDKGHIREHAKETKHIIAVDTIIGGIYCFECADYMYHDDFEKISRDFQIKSCKIRGIVPFSPWEPTDSLEKMLIKKYDVGVMFKDTQFIGLRGLINMGKTCYMNAILQVLTHIPLFRDYFLSGMKHKCMTEKNCIVCETITIFQEIYSGKCCSYVPQKVLYIFWSNFKELASYGDHDAYELFSAYLELLHLHSSDHDHESDANCKCVVHTIFAGLLQWSFTCEACRFETKSGTPEAFLSITLRIEENILSTTLEECLKRYRLPDKCNSFCDGCKCNRDKLKQPILKRLPFTFVIHLNRLKINESKKNNTKYSKISTPVSFPEILDLSDFMLLNKLKPQFGFNEPKYRLCGVVSHKYSKNKNQENISGHFIAFIRLNSNHWFHCDDNRIEPTKIKRVLESEAYMLFYQKLSLDCRFPRI